jgi:hypothetical protein
VAPLKPAEPAPAAPRQEPPATRTPGERAPEAPGPRAADEDIPVIDLPDGSIMHGGGDTPMSAADAQSMYDNTIAETPGREAMILENSVTGERVVVQGHEGGATVSPDVWAQFVADQMQGGNWKVVKHNHPVGEGGVTPSHERFPSGHGGDLAQAQVDAMLDGTPHGSSIDITTESGPVEIRYGYDPGADKPFWIDMPGPGGTRVPERFASLDDYHAWFEQQTGLKLLGAPEGGPPETSGPRVAAPDEAPPPGPVEAPPPPAEAPAPAPVEAPAPKVEPAAAPPDAQAVKADVDAAKAKTAEAGDVVASVKPEGTMPEAGGAAPPQAVDVVAEIVKLRAKQPQLDARVADAEAKLQTAKDEVSGGASEVREALEELAEKMPRHAGLADLDPAVPTDRQKLLDALDKLPPGTSGPLGDVRVKLRNLETAEAHSPARIAEAEAQLKTVRTEAAQAAKDLDHLMAQAKLQAGVPISSKLPEPAAGWGFEPKTLKGGTDANQQSHVNGYKTELNLANHVADNVGDTVLKFGDKPGTHGSDVIAVTPNGDVVLLDAKYLSSGKGHPASDTFMQPGPLADAIAEARRALTDTVSDRLSPEMRAKALKNLAEGNFTTLTVTSADTTSFHTCVKVEFVGGKPGPETLVPVPTGAAKP